MLDDVRFALVDLETTGGQAANDQIMEVAVRQIDFSGGEEWAWQSLIDPQCSIPSFIQGLTGISPSMVRGKPVFSDVQDVLWSHLENAILVAHNARFDAGFLRANFARFGRQYNPPVLCTLKLARTLYPEWPKHGLEAICHRIGFHSEVHHRAMADVDAMKAFLDFARRDVGEAVFNFEVGLLLGLPVLPPSISQTEFDAIPGRAGVYRLLGEAGELLYLGAASSLQEQILSHFSNSAGDSKAAKLARKVAGLKWQAHAGELSAGLYLSAALRHEKPQMQRSAKAVGKPCCVRFVSIDSGGHSLRLRSGLPNDIGQSGESVVLFRDRKQAKARLVVLAKDHDLCLSQLALLSEGQRCDCSVCDDIDGRDDDDAENVENSAPADLAGSILRLKSAFADYLYTPWPFAEAVLIYECNDAGLAEWHLVNDWRYYGSFIWDANRQTLSPCQRAEVDGSAALSLAEAAARCEQQLDFHYDHYRLLRAFLNELEWRPLSAFAEI